MQNKIIITNENEKEYWIEYKKTLFPQIKEALINRYAPLVKYEAFKIKSYSNINIGYTYLNIDYLKNIIDFEDLVGFGFFGLLYAVERYNPNKDIKFKTYARLRIKGAIYDGLREIFPPLPKMIYKDISKIQKAREMLKIKLKREAKPEEIAKILGITIDAYYYYIAMSILPYSIISLNEISRYIENKITPEYRFDILTEEKNAILTNYPTSPKRHSISIKYEPQISFGYWNEDTPIFTLLPFIKYEYQLDYLNGYKNRNYLAYSGAFNLNFYKGYSLYFSYSHDYTAPTFNDLYYGDFGNINLKAEDYNQILTKLTLEPITNLKIEGSYSYTVYSNKIIWYGLKPENVDIAKSHIVNANIGYEIPFLTYNKIKAKVGYSYQLAYMGENKLPKIGMPEDVISVLLGYDFISENNILTSLSLNIYYIYSTKRYITEIKIGEDFHDLNISFYSIWFKHLIISTHFKNIFNKTPILSTYSVAKPFTWEIELGYNF